MQFELSHITVAALTKIASKTVETVNGSTLNCWLCVRCLFLLPITTIFLTSECWNNTIWFGFLVHI